MAQVELADVTKSWGGELAVAGVSFTVRSGQLAALLGPSGCGKSTTLRLIAGLEEATSGTISIAGRDVTHLKPADRNLSMVFQSYALFPHLSVAENILFGLRVRSVAAAERDKRLHRAASMLGLEPLLGRRPSQLSGGQQQRVALGRAIVAETPVCLMDEPLSNLDAQLRLEMRREIRSLQQRLGMTMLYVTHDQLEAMTMADHVILMRGGRIEQQGAPADLYERPATVFAARFVGTPPMNVLSGTALQKIGVAELPAPPPARPLDTLSLGVRAEDARLSQTGVHGTVTTIEYLGADTLLEMLLGGEPFVVRVTGRASVNVRDDVRVTWEPQAAHWFDAASGARLD